MFVAQLKERSDDFRELSAAARRNGGHYSSFKRGGAIPGFLFKTEEARSAFLAEVEGDVDMMSNFEDDGSSVQTLVDSVYDANGEIDHERVQTAVDGILSGLSRIDRLSSRGEQGRNRGTRLCIGASLIVGASSRTIRESDPRKRRKKEEELLEAYAKSQGVWIDDIDAFKSTLDGRLRGGSEVSAFKLGDSVIKIAPIFEMDSADSSILRFFDEKIALHNALPHTAPYELVGFARDLNVSPGTPTFAAILRQPYITGEELSDIDPGFADQLRQDGFTPDPHNNRFFGHGLNVSDAIESNIIKTEDGKYIIFDPQVMYSDRSDYKPFNLVGSDDAGVEVVDMMSIFEGKRPTAEKTEAMRQEFASTNITTLTGNEIATFESGGDMKAFRDAAREWARKHIVGKYAAKAFGGREVEIRPRGVKSDVAHFAGEDKLRSLAGLPDMIRNAILLETVPDRRERQDMVIHRLIAPLEIGKAKLVATLIIREDRNGKLFYDHNLLEIDKLAMFTKPSRPSEDKAGTRAWQADPRILDYIFGVNENDSFSIAEEADRKAAVRLLKEVPIENLPASMVWNRQGDRLKINLSSMEVLRRALEQVDINRGARRFGGEEIMPAFLGLFSQPTRLRGAIDVLRKAAVDARESGFAEQAEQLSKFAEDIYQAGKLGMGTAVFYVDDAKLPQEVFHQAVYLGSVEKAMTRRHMRSAKLDTSEAVRIADATHFSKFARYRRRNVRPRS